MSSSRARKIRAKSGPPLIRTWQAISPSLWCASPFLSLLLISIGARRERKRLQLMLEALILEAKQTPDDRNDLLSLLLNATDPETGISMDSIDVQNNLLTFITAGHETTSLALTWTFYLLSLHPEIEQRVKAEIAAVTEGGPVHPTHIDALAYTNQVIQEAIVLYHPATLIVREARRDIELGNEQIRAGTTVCVPVYAVH